MRYETPQFTIVGDARELVLGELPFGSFDTPLHTSTPEDHLIGMDE